VAIQQLPEDIYKAYLDEMQALENFRVSYTTMRTGATIEREDPDVRRLLDALALFAARTRVAAQRSLLATQRRLFQQYFSYLLTPMPARAIVQAHPTGRLLEAAEIPRHTDLNVGPDGGVSATFRTTRALRVLPLQLAALDMLLMPKAGQRIVFDMRMMKPRRDAPETLRFYVTHLDDYPASLGLLDTIRKHLKKAVAVYDEKATDMTEGLPCEVSFGWGEDPETVPEPNHPVEGVRGYFHFPQGHLYLNVKVPPPEQAWKQLSICIDVDGGWPKNLRLNTDMFQMFTVPVTNLNRAMAKPVEHKGLESRYAILHPTGDDRYSLHSVLGVYEMLGSGLQPLKPGVIASGTGTYEIERTLEEGQGETFWLRLRYPETFETAKKIVADVLWHQPWYSKSLGTIRQLVVPKRRVMPGCEFDVRGDVKGRLENPLGEDFEAMLRILSLKSKEVGLSREDLLTLLEALGVFKGSYFDALLVWIDQLAVETVPLPPEVGGGQRHEYKLRLKDFEAGTRPLVELSLQQLAALLDAWTPDSEVLLEAFLSDGKPFRYEEEAS
jgi:type VI secretion system protein ImpG